MSNFFKLNSQTFPNSKLNYFSITTMLLMMFRNLLSLNCLTIHRLTADDRL